MPRRNILREGTALEGAGLAETGPERPQQDGRRSAERRSLPRILCVDDEPCMLSTWMRVLRTRFERQLEIVTQREPLAALALVQQGESFAVLVADLNMPGMTGIELIGAIRAISPATACILVTGDVAAAHAASARGGVFRSLGKQCHFDLLRQAVADAAEEHARHAAAAPFEARR